jgi:hypothetical protein
VNGTGPIAIDIHEQMVMSAAETAISARSYVFFLWRSPVMGTTFFPEKIIEYVLL